VSDHRPVRRSVRKQGTGLVKIVVVGGAPRTATVDVRRDVTRGQQTAGKEPHLGDRVTSFLCQLTAGELRPLALCPSATCRHKTCRRMENKRYWATLWVLLSVKLEVDDFEIFLWDYWSFGDLIYNRSTIFSKFCRKRKSRNSYFLSLEISFWRLLFRDIFTFLRVKVIKSNKMLL